MGRNKKKPNPPPPPPNTATGAPPPPPTNNPNQEQTDIDQELSLIKSKCNAIHATHKAGNTAQAFALMEETRRHYEYAILVHAAQCKLHVLEASRIGTSDIVLYQNQVRSAIESARRVVSVAPYSIKLVDFYAQTLNCFSSSVEGFDEVLRACERALLVDNPLQLCGDASLSFKGWAYEERCRMSETKKHAVSKENERAEMKMEKSRSYWNEMSDEKKMKLIELKIGDLRKYYSSFCKDGLAKRVFSEGIGYAEKNKNWRFWACYYCDEKFEDFELRMNHIERNHEGLIKQNLQMNPFLFPEIGAEVYHDLQIVNGTIHSIKERIILTGDSSGPLDKRLLRVEVMPHRHHDGVEDDENGSSSTDAEVAVPPDIDAFGQWLFDGPPTSTAEELAAWTHLQDQMKQEGMEVPIRFEDEFIKFQSLPRKQSELMVQARSLGGIHIICAQELNKRRRGGDRVPYKSLLREKLGQLPKIKYDSMSPTQQSEFTAIVGLLKEARNVRQSESNFVRTSEVEDQEDSFIRVAIHKKISELFTNEAEITRSSAVMLRLLVIYKQSCLDYRGIMLPLVRNFIHAELEKQRADDATEALLAELALEAEKNTNKGNSHPKLSKKTSKAKKKIKDHREVKDPKDTCSESNDKLTVAEEERAEQDDFPVVDATVVEEERAELEKQRADDATEALLSKLALEAEKNTNKGNSHPKLSKKTSKAKKRIKDHREVKDPKDTCSESSDKLTVAEEERAEQDDFPVVDATVVEEEKAEQTDFPVVDATAYKFKLQETWNLQRMFENWDYPRQFEKQAKRITLAKETMNEAAPTKATCTDELTVAQESTKENEDEAKQMGLVKETTSEAALIKIEESDKAVVVFSQWTGKRRTTKDILQAWKNQLFSDSLQARKNLPSPTCLRFRTTSGYRYNPGLRNYIGEYDCIINVIVQSLWHLRKFRDMFMKGSTSEHVHIGIPCVVCALKEIFSNLSVASTNYQREALPTTSLRSALIKFNPCSDLFSKPHMYNTCELLAIILDSLHESSKHGSKQSMLHAHGLDIIGNMFESAEKRYASAGWTCGADACVSHNIFGMYFMENMSCFSCGTREIKFTSFFCCVVAGSLRMTKNMHPESHFDELFKIGQRKYEDCAPQFACNPMIGQCGKRRVRRYLTRPPQVFVIALFWDSESKEDISAILRALTTEIDLAVIHDGLVSGNKHSLSSMVCCAGQHHICFAYNHEREIWVMYDDETLKNFCRWEDLIRICEEGHLKPHLLFFEAVE